MLRKLTFGTMLTLLSCAPFFAYAQGAVTTSTQAPYTGPTFTEAADVADGLTVDLSLIPKTPISQVLTTLNLSVNKKPDGKPVTNIQKTDGAQMHIFGIREDLAGYFHITPEQLSGEIGEFSTKYAFPAPGVYKIWTEVTSDNVTRMFGQKKISVSGGGEIEPEVKDYPTNVMVGNFQIELDKHVDFVSGLPNEFNFIVRDVFGRGVVLDESSGYPMHLVVVKDDLKEFMHLHPVPAPPATTGNVSEGFHLINVAEAHVVDNGLDVRQYYFNVTFPSPGTYKLFAEFVPTGEGVTEEGKTMTAEFYVDVIPGMVSNMGGGTADSAANNAISERGVAPPPVIWYASERWWGLFLGSIILMVLLSLWVRKLLTNVN